MVEEGFPAVVIAKDERDMHAAAELQARGAKVFMISSNSIPEGMDGIASGFSGIEHSAFSAVFGQLLAYHSARLRGLPIDRPRNLAKSVTVL